MDDVKGMLADLQHGGSNISTTALLCVERAVEGYIIGDSAYYETIYVFVVAEGKVWDGIYVFGGGMGMQGPIWKLLSAPEHYSNLTDMDIAELEDLHK